MEKVHYFILTRNRDGVEKAYHLVDRLVVGRASICHVILDDEGVSRQHCELRPGRAGVVVKDLGSTNGTYLNGAKVDEGVARPGDAIVVGEAWLLVRAGEPAADGEGARTGVLGDTTVEVVLRAAAERVPDKALFQEAGLAGDAFRALFRVTDLLNAGSADEESMLREFLGILMELYGMDLGAVYLVEEEGGGRLRCQAEVKAAGAAPYAASQSVLARVVDENVSVAAHDPLKDPRFKEARSIVSSGAARILCVPMRAAGRVLGAVYLSSLPTSHGRSAAGAAGEQALQVLVALASQMAQALENLRHRALLERDNQILRSEKEGGVEIIGSSAAMDQVRRLVAKVAGTEATVLITGESGTGKELIAASIHLNSRRRARPMISINCGAIPETVVESELFGHERGAFTGAMERKSGRFELAHGGTLFLDEVGELPLALQVKLLRVLEEKRFYRVGGEQLVHADVRILAATNAPLEERVREHRFREDLYYRLKVFHIEAPPLREHREDIPELADWLLARLAGQGVPITREGVARLEAYPWPGNVRELRNALERELILNEGGPLAFTGLGAAPAAGGTGPAGAGLTLDQIAEAHIREVLASTRWNKQLAAKILGISRPTLYDKIKQYGITEEETRR